MPTLTLFTKFPGNALGGEAGADVPIDFLTDTIKVQLHTAVTSFAQDTDEFLSDVLDEVANGNGYTTGGVTLSAKAVTTDAATNKMIFDNTVDPSWTATGAGFSANSALFVKSTGTAATSPLIGWLDFGSTITLASGDTLTIQLDATNGIFYTTVP